VILTGRSNIRLLFQTLRLPLFNICDTSFQQKLINNSICNINTTFTVLLLYVQQHCTTAEMDMFRNVSTLVNQEDSLAAMNNESVIQLLGLDGKVEQSRLLDDIVAHLGLDSFNKATKVVPATGLGFETTAQGQQHHVGYAPMDYATPVYSYIDLHPTETQNSPNHKSENYLTQRGGYQEENTFAPTPSVEPPVSSFYLTPPSSPQEVSSSIITHHPVANHDTHKPTGAGKTQRGRSKGRGELKTKLYQREQPLSDPEEEKKRLNAINAKKNRDKQKNRMQELENLVTSLAAEKETLQTTNSKLKRKCDAFEKQLKSICQQLKVPVVILPQE